MQYIIRTATEIFLLKMKNFRKDKHFKDEIENLKEIFIIT